jgi:hypothetical protein
MYIIIDSFGARFSGAKKASAGGSPNQIALPLDPVPEA